MPGSLMSMPYTVLPVVLSGVSRRLTPLPASFQSFGAFSLTLAGGSSRAAASTTLPQVVVRPARGCVGGDAVGGRASRRRRVPFVGHRLHQHHARGGAALADVVLRGSNAAA